MVKKNGSPVTRLAGLVGSGVVVDLESGARTYGVSDKQVDVGQRFPKPRDEMLKSSWCLGVIAGLLFLSQLGLCATARADTGGSASYETLAIPFPFYNESFGFALGYVYGRSGWPEPQSRALGTVMGGTVARPCCS